MKDNFKLSIAILRKNVMKNLLIEQFVSFLWEDINNLDFLKENKLEGFIYYYCYNKNCFDSIKETTRDLLKEKFIENKIKNTILWSEYSKLKKICDYKNISVLLVRGLYLINTVYESFGQRTMNDIDIIYNRRDYFDINYYLLSILCYKNDLESTNLYKKDVKTNDIVFSCKFDFMECDKLPTILHHQKLWCELYVLLKSLFESEDEKINLKYEINCSFIKLLDLLLFLLHFKAELNNPFLLDFKKLNYTFYDYADNCMLIVFKKSIKEIIVNEKI